MTIDHREQLERIKAEIADSFDEELEMQLEEDRLDALVAEGGLYARLARLQFTEGLAAE